MLTYCTQITLSHQTAWHITPDNRLDMDKLMAAFQAFLQRIINSGGMIEREYGLGRQMRNQTGHSGRGLYRRWWWS